MGNNMVDIIQKKKDGEALSPEEIRFFVEGYTAGDIPDYQASALLMAICFRGMDRQETFLLTEAMRLSGDMADLSAIKGVKVDKHSTGGVGDKTTLIAGPLAAACGVPVAKMSGRGLGFTGGTVDKLEAIPGFRTTLEAREFVELVNRRGISLIGQTAHIAPADKKLYALRDVTATVMEPSLIAASIMSKKLASGSDAIVLDVKCGRGSFNATEKDAERLALLLRDLGQDGGKRTMALVTDMEQPLGRAVGNSLEVIEAIETLKGRGPEDITELSLVLAGYMVYAGGRGETPEEGRRRAEEALRSGAGLEKLGQLIEGQGGDPGVLEDYSLFPRPVCKAEARAEKKGFVQGIDARAAGAASQHAGAGRKAKGDAIDLAAGLLLGAKTGEPVEKGDLLVTAWAATEEKAEEAAAKGAAAYVIGPEPPVLRPLVHSVVL
ncbi:MAG: thymidine phosphorylase [Bacillota bacterium]|nr:thymidine phosphorylase [Bacillota bacterium]